MSQAIAYEATGPKLKKMRVLEGANLGSKGLILLYLLH
jgi:hypothetical protein